MSNVGVVLATRLARVVVLFRQPDSLALWGVPYRMRPGQQPGDLWRAARAWRMQPTPKPGVVGSKLPKVELDDWIWLGSPGWWGSYSEADRREIEAFLAPWRARDMVPGNPFEWSELEPCNLTEEIPR